MAGASPATTKKIKKITMITVKFSSIIIFLEINFNLYFFFFVLWDSHACKYYVKQIGSMLNAAPWFMTHQITKIAQQM